MRFTEHVQSEISKVLFQNLPSPSGETIYFTNKSIGESWQGRIRIYEDARLLDLRLTAETSPLSTPTDWLAELALRLNSAVPFGAYVFVHETSRTRFRLSRSFEEYEVLNSKLLSRMLTQASFATKIWREAINIHSISNCSPTSAISFALSTMRLDNGPQASQATATSIVNLAHCVKGAGE